MPPTNRIAKVIARAGICSRREAERMISDGRVQVDGKIIDKPGINVSDDQIILVDGKPLPIIEEEKLWLFHKPKGCITSHKDPQGRTTVFDLLPKSLPRVISVGRLDYNTEGLLLLTNSGEISRHIELPSTGWVRKYKVRAYGRLDNSKLDHLRKGTTIDNIKYAPAQIEITKSQKDNHWLILSISEGKNREVRKMLAFAGLEVNRLIRTEYGPFKLGKIPVGKIEPVAQKSLNSFIKI